MKNLFSKVRAWAFFRVERGGVLSGLEGLVLQELLCGLRPQLSTTREQWPNPPRHSLVRILNYLYKKNLALGFGGSSSGLGFDRGS